MKLNSFENSKKILLSFVSVILQIAVPRHSVGVVIGRSGEMIKKIQSDAGVKIQFKPGELSKQ